MKNERKHEDQNSSRQEWIESLSPNAIQLIKSLAQESELSSRELVENLVKAEDSKRHVMWSPKEQGFVRVKCGLDNCAETRRGSGDLRD